MCVSGVSGWLVSAALLLFVPGELPDELLFLEEIARNEGQLVDAARRFDLHQQALIEWDQSLIAEYMDAGQDDLAATKSAELTRRVEVLGTMWGYVMEYYPNNARANNYYGEFLYDFAGDEARAVQLWKTAAQVNDKFAPPHNNLGIHYFHQGRYKDGYTHLKEALKLDEKNPDYLYNMAQMYLIHFHEIGPVLKYSKAKLYREAMKMSELAAEYAPDDFEILQDYAVNFFAAEQFGVEADWEDAAAAWAQVRGQSRTEEETFYALLNEGRSWLRSGKPDRAVDVLEEAKALRPESQVAGQLLSEAQAGVG